MPDITSFKQARARGLNRYFTGEPCVKGHISQRIVSSRHCVTCHYLAQEAWKKNNPDKVKENNRKMNKSRVLRGINRKKRCCKLCEADISGGPRPQRLCSECGLDPDRIKRERRKHYLLFKNRHRQKRFCNICSGDISERPTNTLYCSKCRKEISNEFSRRHYLKHLEERRARNRQRPPRADEQKKQSERRRKVNDLLEVLGTEMPELLKEFGL